MKGPQLTYVREESKGYYVLLGNGAKKFFKNRKDADRFLAETNRFLTKKLVELNEAYTYAFCQYRQIWPVLTNDRGRKTNYREHANTIREGINSVELQLEKLGTPSYGSNDFIVFINAKKCCLFLSEVLKALEFLHKKWNNTVASYSIENAINRVYKIADEINNYGQDENDNPFRVPDAGPSEQKK